MLPKMKELAEKQGVTVECKPSTEKINYIWYDYGWPMELTDKYKDKVNEFIYPGQSEMVCRDSFGEVLSKKTSFNLPFFEAWILSDSCNPERVAQSCFDKTSLFQGNGNYFVNFFCNFS